MTRARGVSQTLRNTRHEARDFRQDWNKKHKVSMHVIVIFKFKIKNVHLKISKNCVSEQITYHKTNIYYKMKLTFLIKLMTQVVTKSRSQTGLYLLTKWCLKESCPESVQVMFLSWCPWFSGSEAIAVTTLQRSVRIVCQASCSHDDLI